MTSKLAFAILPLCVGAAAQTPEPISRRIGTDVTVTRDLVYAAYGSRALKLDLYSPAKRSAAPLPTIVVIRGGGWQQGDKEAFAPMAAALAQRGFAAVCIEYRASAEAVYPAAVEDTKAAVRWIRANAGTYGLDADSIGAFGGSAGAHLALLLGVTDRVSDLEGDGGNPRQSSSISAVVGLAAPGDFRALQAAASRDNRLVDFIGASYEDDPKTWEAASPISHVGRRSPAALLMHSTADNVVPFEQSLQLAGAYGEAGVPLELVLIPDAPHAFWNFEQWFGATMDRAAGFFQAHLAADEPE